MIIIIKILFFIIITYQTVNAEGNILIDSNKNIYIKPIIFDGTKTTEKKQEEKLQYLYLMSNVTNLKLKSKKLLLLRKLLLLNNDLYQNEDIYIKTRMKSLVKLNHLDKIQELNNEKYNLEKLFNDDSLILLIMNKTKQKDKICNYVNGTKPKNDQILQYKLVCNLINNELQKVELHISLIKEQSNKFMNNFYEVISEIYTDNKLKIQDNTIEKLFSLIEHKEDINISKYNPLYKNIHNEYSFKNNELKNIYQKNKKNNFYEFYKADILFSNSKKDNIFLEKILFSDIKINKEMILDYLHDNINNSKINKLLLLLLSSYQNNENEDIIYQGLVIMKEFELLQEIIKE